MGTGGTAPKFEVGDGPCIRPPNIWRSSDCSVIGNVGKYEQQKTKTEIFCEIDVFVKKRVIYYNVMY